FWEMPVAIVEGGRRICDADDGLLQQRTRVAHGLREGAAQVEREIAVAVVGEAVLEPVFAHSLYLAASRLIGRQSANAQHFTAIRIKFLTLARQLSPRQGPWNASNLGASQRSACRGKRAIHELRGVFRARPCPAQGRTPLPGLCRSRTARRPLPARDLAFPARTARRHRVVLQ